MEAREAREGAAGVEGELGCQQECGTRGDHEEAIIVAGGAASRDGGIGAIHIPVAVAVSGCHPVSATANPQLSAAPVPPIRDLPITAVNDMLFPTT